MKNNWQKVKLGDICGYSRSRIPISEVNLHNYVSTENLLKERGGKIIAGKIPEQSNFYEYNKGCTLVSNIRPYFKKIWFADIRGGCSNDVLVYTPNKGINDKWLYYLLSQDSFFDFVMSGHKGTKMPRGDKSQIMKFSVALPPLDEQKKIAEILSALDDKIELNNKINRNLEAQAQAIFKSWFVDFEPFKNGKFIDSEFGKIPEYWQVVKFSEFLKPRIEKINNSTITEYSVTNSGIFKRDEKFKKRLSGAKTFNKIIYYADMVFGMSREILNWGLMRDQIGSVSSAYTVFSVNTELVDLSYLEFFMRYHHEYFKSIIRLASREGQGIDKAVLFNKCVIIPDTNAIARFLEILNSISNSRLAINEESRRLVQLRDALLPKLMSGEIDVANVAV